jgi:replication factor A1
VSKKNSEPEDQDIFNQEYVVQFLSLKKVGTTGGDGRTGFDRYRIIMSDGTFYMQAMLATQLNSLVQENHITKGSIVVLEKLTCNYVQEKRCVLLV